MLCMKCGVFTSYCAMFVSLHHYMQLKLPAGGGWGAGGAKQRSASWYFLLFQYEGKAEKLLQADEWQLFREFLGPTVKPTDMAAYISDLSRPGALSAGDPFWISQVLASL